MERLLKRKNDSFGGSHAFADLIPSLTNCDQFMLPASAAVMSIRLVEPDLKDPLKARHVFECQECGLSRAYLMITGEPSQLAARPPRGGQWNKR